jgi:hypothetical protein
MVNIPKVNPRRPNVKWGDESHAVNYLKSRGYVLRDKILYRPVHGRMSTKAEHSAATYLVLHHGWHSG